MAVDYLDWNSIIDWLYNPFTQAEDTIHIGGPDSGDPDPEERLIPNSFPFQIKLFFSPKYEIPSNMQINIKGGATLYEVPDVQEPGYNQFRVCYDEKGIGIIEFNSLQKNLVVQIKYKATASTIQKALFESHSNKIYGQIETSLQNSFLTFADGINWITKNLDTTGFDGIIHDIIFDEDLRQFIAVGIYSTFLKIWESTDLTTWEEIFSINKGAMTWGFKKIVFSESLGTYIAIGDFCYYSYDLENWTESDITAIDYVNDAIWVEDLGLFFAVGFANGSPRHLALSSPDGITWTGICTVGVGDTDSILHTVRYEDSQVVACGGYDATNPLIGIYAAGILLKVYPEVANIILYDLIYVDSLDLWITCGQTGKIYTAAGSSPSSWTLRASGIVTDLKKIAKTESRIIIAGADKTILVSSNGTSWSDYSLLGTDVWNVTDIIFENDVLIIVTDDNRIIYSDDITTFTELSLTPVTINLKGIRFLGGLFFLFGDSGYISTNGVMFLDIRTSEQRISDSKFIENYISSEINDLIDSGVLDSSFFRIDNDLSEGDPAMIRTNIGALSYAEIVTLIEDFGGLGSTAATKTADYTSLDDDGISFLTFDFSGYNLKMLNWNLPTLADNIGRNLSSCISTSGILKINAEGAEKILLKNKELSTLYLYSDGNNITFKATSKGWRVVSKEISIPAGWFQNSDQTNFEYGIVKFNYDNLVGTFAVGEYISMNGVSNTAIVLEDTGSVMTVYACGATQYGLFTDNWDFSGNQSGATGKVNHPGANNINQMNSITHNWGLNGVDLGYELWYNTSASFTNAFDLAKFCPPGSAGAVPSWAVLQQVSINSHNLQSSTGGLVVPDGSGNTTRITTTQIYLYLKLYIK